MKSPGQVAFEAYKAQFDKQYVAWFTSMSYKWETLPDFLRVGWEAAARAVLEDQARKNEIVVINHFRDANGVLLWIDPLVMAKLHAPGETVVHNSVHYTVKRVALASGVQHVNVEPES